MPNLQKFMSEVGQYGFQKSNWFDFRISALPFIDPNYASRNQIYGPQYGTTQFGFENFLQQGLVCTSVSLPGRGFATADQSIYGFTRKVPYFSEFPPLSCTFVVPIGPDGTNFGASYFRAWMNQIQNVPQNETSQETVDVGQGAFDMAFPETYYAEAEIRQYSFIDVSQTDTTAQINMHTNTLNGSSTLGRAATTFADAYLSKNEPSNPNAGQTIRQVSLRHRFYQLYPASIEATPLNWADTDSFTQITVTFNYSYWVDMGLSADTEDNILVYSRGKDRTPSKIEKFFGTLKDAALDEARFRGWIK